MKFQDLVDIGATLELYLQDDVTDDALEGLQLFRQSVLQTLRYYPVEFAWSVGIVLMN